jgi:VanZ family protein
MQKINSFSFSLQIWLWLPVLGCAVFIFYLSSLESVTGPDIPYLDKLLHIIEYAFFAFLLMRAICRAGFKVDKLSALALTIIIAFVYGIGDEIHQIFVVGRTASFFDALTDLIGASLGSHAYKQQRFL